MDLKEKIIIESLKLFSMKGFLSTSIQDILEASGTSKGGFYNHFQSKEELFYQVLREAQKIWRERNLRGVNEAPGAVDKLRRLLANYRDRYLKDSENFPGGCLFVTLSVELDEQLPHLAREINKGFEGFRAMLNRWLEKGKKEGSIREDVNTAAAADLIFNGMLGTSVTYGTQKSPSGLEQSIAALMDYLEGLAPWS
ncbi:MAG: hypothetical protein DRH20_04610 [Deltaproteobacteria bacterium]|nr:MAG: hypothetical protein DRH20_04610 [Deltaproteobacteria bacterium]